MLAIMKANKNFIYISYLCALLSVSVVGSVSQSDVCKKFHNYSNNDVVALILARGGSKGIPLKNLAQIGVDTLLGRALKTILRSQIFADVWVSTDHQGIAEEATKHNVNVHIRPKHFAEDNTTSIASVQEFLGFHPEVKNLALIQCTSVFLKEQYLLEAVQLFQNRQLDCVFTATRSFKLRWNYNPNLAELTPLNFDPRRRPRRQDWNGELIETGMIYLAKKAILQLGVFQNERCGFVEVNSDDELEIDSPAHLQLANVLISIGLRQNRTNVDNA